MMGERSIGGAFGRHRERQWRRRRVGEENEDGERVCGRGEAGEETKRLLFRICRHADAEKDEEKQIKKESSRNGDRDRDGRDPLTLLL